MGFFLRFFRETISIAQRTKQLRTEAYLNCSSIVPKLEVIMTVKIQAK